MKFIDVFNGDADGICALHQLRLANPVDSVLVTGIKRDINLLKRVAAGSGDKITVLDISLDKNRDGLMRLLQTGAEIMYFDHHFAGGIPANENLKSYIDTDSNMCTSLLVNEYLGGKFLPWAVAAAFGDNLFGAAENAARLLSLSANQLEELKLLGTCINYNGYGASLDDLFFTPDALYKMIHPYSDPFDFIKNENGYQLLLNGYRGDIAAAESIEPIHEDDTHALYLLPDEKWARRVSGVFANQLAQQNPNRAHAMLTQKNDAGYLVSVRAPLNNKTGADELCRQFATGGGRKAAAGINHLPEEQYQQFFNAFVAAF
ncbi:DHH family phosphoesterase [Kaarinaea lacus]